MYQIVRFLKTRSFAVLLFHFGVLLFNWPLLSLPSKGGGTSIFTYLIVTWTVLVVLLILVGQSIRHGERSGEGD